MLFGAGTLSENEIVETCKPESGRDQLPLSITTNDCAKSGNTVNYIV